MSATIGCCEDHSRLIRLWMASEHPLRDRWISLIRRYCTRNCI